MAQNKGFSVIFSHETEYHYSEEMTGAFRRFSQGMKVAVEPVAIACLKEASKEGIDVVSLADSSLGVDTATLINSTSNFSTVKIREVICIPR